MDYDALFREMKAEPRRYGVEPTLEAAVTFVDALDLANERGRLIGFQEWLAVRSGGGRDSSWQKLMHELAAGGPLVSEDDHRAAIRSFLDLLLEFLPIKWRPGDFRLIYGQLAKLPSSREIPLARPMPPAGTLDLATRLQNLKKRAGMYFLEPTFDQAAAHVDGIDAAYANTLLLCSPEWLKSKLRARRLHFASNLWWHHHVLALAFPDQSNPRDSLTSPAAQQCAIETLFDLLLEFLPIRRRPLDLQRIMFLYLGIDDRGRELGPGGDA